MPSIYLQSSDYATYGLPNTTTESQIIQASAIIDAFLSRPEGLIYTVDGNGNPCYMVAKTPTFSIVSTSAISPGSSVSVTVSGAFLSIKTGDILILDKGTSNITEACLVNSITGNTIILDTVLFNHSIGATLDAGMVINEVRNAPYGRNIVQAMQTPIARLLSGQGQYGYPRRGDNIDYNGMVYNALVVFAYSGGPPLYENWNVNPPYTSIEADTGVIYYPTGIYYLAYTKVIINYVAGWTYANLPTQIKQACANLVMAQTSSAGIVGNVSAYRAGDTEIRRFVGGSGNRFSLIDEDTKNMLMPFRSRPFI